MFENNQLNRVTEINDVLYISKVLITVNIYILTK